MSQHHSLFGYGNIVWQESAGRWFKSNRDHKIMEYTIKKSIGLRFWIYNANYENLT